MFERYVAIHRIKPIEVHSSSDSALNLGASHSIQSLVYKDSGDNVLINDTYYSDSPGAALIIKLGGILGWIPIKDLYRNDFVVLGTSHNEMLSYLDLLLHHNAVVYGGNGDDQIATSTADDILIGGNGNDELIGGWGDDTYVYFRGENNDDIDLIHDTGGYDTIRLNGFDYNSNLSVLDMGDRFRIVCEGENIADVIKVREGSLGDNNFVIEFDNGTRAGYKMDISDYFERALFVKHLVVGCPVGVEIVDTQGNVVYTLNDGEPGLYVTEYGSFFVYEEEDGSYGKVLDLVEGYDARIIGNNTGTMDISVSNIEAGVPSEPVMFNNIPVNVTLAGQIKETTDGNAYFETMVDTNGDGIINDADISHEHSWDDGVITAASCTSAGLITYSCAECDIQRMETVAYAADHVCDIKYNESLHWKECVSCSEKFERDYHEWDNKEDLANAHCTMCGAEYPDKTVNDVAQLGDTGYDTLAEAMAVAQEGDTVKLLKDIEEKYLQVNEGITLDINGHKVTAAYVMCYGNLKDSSNSNSGLLKVSDKRFLIQHTNEQLPVRTDEGYIFCDVTKFNEAILYSDSDSSISENGIKFVFQPFIESAAHQIILDGDSGVKIEVLLRWPRTDGTTSTQSFAYSAEKVKKYLDSYDASADKYGQMFTLLLKNARNYEDLTCKVRVISETGVEFLSDGDSVVPVK